MSNPILKTFELTTEEKVADFVGCSWYALNYLRQTNQFTHLSRLICMGIRFLEIEQRDDGYYLIVNQNDENFGCVIELRDEDLGIFLGEDE